MDFVDLKNKSAEDLYILLSEKTDELRGLNFKVKTGQLKQVHKIKEVRREIARVRMLLAAKK